MKQNEDRYTLDLIGGVPRGRGRPLSDVPAASAAERQAKRRERLREEGRVPLTVTISAEVAQALENFLRFKDETKDSCVERVLRDRLLRKR